MRRKEPATLSGIADTLGLQRSSTFNLIQTLADRGYLCEPGRRSGYYPSPRWFAFAQQVAAAEPLPKFAHALVAELGDRRNGGGWRARWHQSLSTCWNRPRPYFAQVGNRLPISASMRSRPSFAARPSGYHRSLADFSPDLAGVALPLPVGDRRLSIVVAGPMFRILDRLELAADIIRRAVKRHAALPDAANPMSQFFRVKERA